MTPQAQSTPERASLPRLMGLCMCARFLVDTTFQLFNPFLPIFAAGLGLDLLVLGRLISLRSLMGLLLPLVGVLADRHGYRRIMRLALVVIALGLLLIGVVRTPALIVVSMLLIGLGLSSFVPNLQAYLSARLPYSTRARYLGILEYSWALAGIVGLYSVGQLIEWAGWRAPLFVLSVGLLVMAGVLGWLPAAHAAETGRAEPLPSTSSRSGRERLHSFWDLGTRSRSAYSSMVVGLLIFFAGMQNMITHGAWLNREYALGAAQLGSVALLLGCFDLLASVSVSLFTDRFGKRRSVMLGLIGSLVGYILLPFLNLGVAWAVAGIALARTWFEFTVVSQIPLVSEQSPGQRGKMLSFYSTVTLIGGALAGITGPWLYTVYGVWGLSISSAAAMGVAIVFLALFVRE